MFDSETVAFVSGECDASSMKVAFFQVQPCSSSILRGNRTVSTVPGLCDSEISHFLVARRAFVTCFRRVTIDLAGICKGKLEIVTCFVRHKKKTIKLFLTREARYDFEFSLANASENDHNAPKARYDCAPCYCKMLSTVLFCVSRCGAGAFSIRNSINSWFTLLIEQIWLRKRSWFHILVKTESCK